eukprot:387917_1
MMRDDHNSNKIQTYNLPLISNIPNPIFITSSIIISTIIISSIIIPFFINSSIITSTIIISNIIIFNITKSNIITSNIINSNIIGCGFCFTVVFRFNGFLIGLPGVLINYKRKKLLYNFLYDQQDGDPILFRARGNIRSCPTPDEGCGIICKFGVSRELNDERIDVDPNTINKGYKTIIMGCVAPGLCEKIVGRISGSGCPYILALTALIIILTYIYLSYDFCDIYLKLLSTLLNANLSYCASCSLLKLFTFYCFMHNVFICLGLPDYINLFIIYI